MRNDAPGLWTLARRVPSLWVGLCLLAMLVVGNVADTARDVTFAVRGVIAPGTVVDKSLERAHGRFDETRYLVSYAFRTLDGRPFQGTDRVDVDTWEALEPHAAVEVKYLAGEPSIHRLRHRYDRAWPAVGGTLLLGAIGAVLTINGVRKIRRWRHILRTGVPAEATVTAVRTRATQPQDVSDWNGVIRYRYKDHLGQEREATSGYVSKRVVSAWKPGDRCAIRFDPDRPQDSVWIGEAGSNRADTV